jgi:hypothetical protein
VGGREGGWGEGGREGWAGEFSADGKERCGGCVSGRCGVLTHRSRRTDGGGGGRRLDGLRRGRSLGRARRATHQVLTEVHSTAAGASLLHLECDLGPCRANDHSADLLELEASGRDEIAGAREIADGEEQVACHDFAAAVRGAACDGVEHYAFVFADFDCETQPSLLRGWEIFYRRVVLSVSLYSGYASNQGNVQRVSLAFQP